MDEDIKVEEGSGNVFSDLGFGDEEAKEELLKAELGAEFFRILKHRRLTQTKAARILGVKQPEISRSLRRRKIHFNGQVMVGIVGRAVEKCQAVKRL